MEAPGQIMALVMVVIVVMLILVAVPLYQLSNASGVDNGGARANNGISHGSNSSNSNTSSSPIIPIHPFSNWLHQQCLWSTMECSQLAAWTVNRSLLVMLCVKAFPGRLTDCGSTLPTVALDYLDGGVIGSHQCLHLALRMCCGMLQHATNPLCSVRHACRPPPPSLPSPNRP